jgi:hypothetical protein
VNGLITPNNNKVLNSDIIHSYDNDKTVETNVKRKKETPNEKDTDAAAHNSRNKKNHIILIIGDSHTRGYASELKENLDETYNITGIIKPGADLSTLSNSVEGTVLTLGKNYIISKNNSKMGLRHILNFISNNIHTNIISLGVPH